MLYEEFNKKFIELRGELPSGFDGLKDVTVKDLLGDAKRLHEDVRILLEKASRLFTQYEGLKQFNARYYAERMHETQDFKEAILYDDLWGLLMFYEFWGNSGIARCEEGFTAIPKINQAVNKERFNKIRNAIAHLDVDFNNGELLLKDKNYERRESIVKICALSSWLITSVVILAHSNSIHTIAFNLQHQNITSSYPQTSLT